MSVMFAAEAPRMTNDELLAELNLICAGAKEMAECGSAYIFLPALHLPDGCTPKQVDALLRLSSTNTDYPTRLFFLAWLSLFKRTELERV